MREVELKLARVRQLLDEENLDGLLLTRKNNFAWLTGGQDCHIATVGERGAAELLVTRDGQYVLTNNIEMRRLMDEELYDLPFTPHVREWYQGGHLLQGEGGLDRLGADTDLPGCVNLTMPLARIRAALLPEEIARYRWLGERTGEILEAVCREIWQGEEERQIAARLAQALLAEGITPYVTLVAADERVFNYRHPIPTAKNVDQYVMVVICAEKCGLIANATRLVHFGELSVELHNKLQRVLQVEAALITATRPGRPLNEIFAAGVAQYAAVGFDNQWQYHHQGGPTGYNPRDFLATPECTEIVQENQAFAWNPSITGVKTEDTILVTASGFEWLTQPRDWPTITVAFGGQKLVRPAILVK